MSAVSSELDINVNVGNLGCKDRYFVALRKLAVSHGVIDGVRVLASRNVVHAHGEGQVQQILQVVAWLYVHCQVKTEVIRDAVCIPVREGQIPAAS